MEKVIEDLRTNRGSYWFVGSLCSGVVAIMFGIALLMENTESLGKFGIQNPQSFAVIMLGFLILFCLFCIREVWYSQYRWTPSKGGVREYIQGEIRLLRLSEAYLKEGIASKKEAMKNHSNESFKIGLQNLINDYQERLGVVTEEIEQFKKLLETLDA